MRKILYKILVYILLFNILVVQSMATFAQGLDTQVHTPSSQQEEVEISEVEIIDFTVEEGYYINEEYLINISANSANGVESKYLLKNLSTETWTTLQDYSEENNYIWMPTEAGKYQIEVHVRDKESTAVLDDSVSKDIEVKNALETEEKQELEEVEVIEEPLESQMRLQSTMMGIQERKTEIHTKYTDYSKSLKQAIVEQVMRRSPQAWVTGGGWRNATVNEVTRFINPNNVVSGDLSKLLFTIEVNTSTLNVRQSPNTTSPVLTQVNRGQVYTVLSMQDGWYKISAGNITGWVSGDLVKTIINRNALQFLVLSESLGIPAEELNKKLTNAGILKGQGAAFLQGSKNVNVNELYLIAHALLETGNGNSDLAKGELVSSVDGKAVEPKMVYNMFGIGARDSDLLKLGSERAYKEGWFTPEQAIIGGAKWIAESYIHHPNYRQDTLYKMRWNPQTPGHHQYATDVNWAYAQTRILEEVVLLAYTYGLDLKFDIPSYNPNMGHIPTGWVTEGNRTYYISNDGVIQTGWRFMNGSWYYLSDSGVMATGWARDDGKRYYFNDKGQMQTGWTFADGSWYYLSGSGVMQTGWFTDGGIRYFLNSSGAMQRGWLLNGGNWYYFNGSGAMQRGWIDVGNKRYFLNNHGVMQTGWLEQNNRLYFLSSDGSVQTGLIKDGDKTYYLSPNGKIQTGWVLHEGEWYYFNASGVMETGWIFRGSWYYLAENGIMQTGWLDEGGERYFLNSSGSMRRGWLLNENNWYYLNGSGRMQTGWFHQGNKTYFLSQDDGSMQTGWVQDGIKRYFLSDDKVQTGWVRDEGKWYFFNRDGVMQTGWVFTGSRWYHLADNGEMNTGWLRDEGKWYFLSSSGAMHRGWLLDGGDWYYLNGSGIMQTGWLWNGGKWYYLKPNGAKAVNTTIEGYTLCEEGTIVYREMDTVTARTIIIDPGHGGRDPGAVGNGIQEKVINFQIAQKLENELKKLGYNIIMTRNSDVYLSLSQRTALANNTNGEIFISIHANSFETSHPRGIETFHFPTSSKGEYLATFIQKEVIKATGAISRGVKTDNFQVLRETRMPSALIEVGFISNPQDAANISNGAYQNRIVSGMVKGIQQYFEKH